MFAPLAFLSLCIEGLLGYPKWLTRAIGHPVMAMGSLIAWLDRTLNRDADDFARRRIAGLGALAVIVCAWGFAGWLLQTAFDAIASGVIFLAFVASSLLAQNSLAAHVAAVADALEREGLEAGREAVSQIVGRDTAVLDEAGVCRAAIESLAENFSDGVVAPAVWLAIAGAPGVAIYKAVNTADSMIGHRTARHEAFGWAAARCDDLVNLPASRLSSLLIVAAAALTPNAKARRAWTTTARDAPNHRSPNAGWPEAAMAGALGLSLAGPRVYDGAPVDDCIMGAGGRREADVADIRAALRLYWIADFLLIALVGFLALAITWPRA